MNKLGQAMREIQITALLNVDGEIGQVHAGDIHIEDDHLGTVKFTFRTDGLLTGVSVTVTDDSGPVTYEWDATP